jgi:hypothetical protein
MSPRHFLLAVGLLLSSFTAFAGTCRPERLAKFQVPIFVDEQTHQVWLANNPMIRQFFTELGYHHVGDTLSDLKKLPPPTNAGSCSADAKKSSPTLYVTDRSSFALSASTDCHTTYAKYLGLNPYNPQASKLGSTEMGIQIAGNDFEVCNNGSGLVSCAALKTPAERTQSLSCWKMLSAETR